MKYLKFLCLLSVFFLFANSTDIAYGADNEVWESGNIYYWKTNNVTRGSSTDLTDAIQGAINNSSGNREIHVYCSGNLTRTISLSGDLTLRFHNNSLKNTHGATAFHREGSGNIKIYDLTLDNTKGGFGFRLSRASDLHFENINIKGGSIGIRVDSHPSRPYEDGRWVYNLTVKNCTFEGCSSHGLETYGVDGCYIDNIKARDCGECGVLLNKTVNGTVGSVDAYRCCYGGGYAGFRLANYCKNITVDYIKSVECGRGFFTVSDIRDVTVKEVYIRDCSNHSILLQNSDNVRILGGTYGGVALNHYTSSNCLINANAVRRIRNRATNMYLDGMGRTDNGADVSQYANTTHPNAHWVLVPVGNYYYLVNEATGMKIDGYGRTVNGDAVSQYSGSTTHANAQWSLVEASNGYYYIVNRATGMKLDGYGRTGSGDICSQYSGSTTHYNAQWTFVDTKYDNVLNPR
ncbi:MAG: RICIN domain-containing protein [Bacillota bacterium]|nr:RICIN domain-containing protein [Bacillota bacterium]